MLTELRAKYAEALKNAPGMPVGFTTYEYVAESLEPPCAAVVPREPYVRPPSPANPQIPFGCVGVGLDVLLLTTREDAKAEAELADQVIEAAYAALREVTEGTITVSRPGVVTVSGSKFIGSVLSIEEVTEEPRNA